MSTIIDTLVDRTIEAYVNWREACVRVDEAYASWDHATGGVAAKAFSAYAAALDREARAAEVYARRVQRVGVLLPVDELPGTLDRAAAGELR